MLQCKYGNADGINRKGRYTMGDKGGKKDKSKHQKQDDNKRKQKEKNRKDKQPKKIPQ